MEAELRHRRFPTDSEAYFPSPSAGEPPTLGGDASTRSSSVSSSGNTPSVSRASSLSSASSSSFGLFSRAADEFELPLFDLLVSLDAHIDLFQRRLKPLTEEWKAKAREAQAALEKRRDGLKVREFRERRSEAERELKEFRDRIKARVKVLQERWNDSKIVSLRDKISFFCGVNNVLITSLLLAFWPQYIPLAFTAQCVYYLPVRVYSYKKLSYHYFCFDLCYYVNFLVLVFLWGFPQSTMLFRACFGLSLGPLASAIATWRNSLVFHSLEKVTSLFIHIYPPLVFIVLVHFYPSAGERYPALATLAEEGGLGFGETMLVSSAAYMVWQYAYWRFVLVARKSKIEAGRVTSFSYMLNAKKGLIPKILHKIPAERRAGSFIVAQFVYTLVTMLPGVLWFYDSKVGAGLYLWAMFAVSVWNGASFYMEVFGRRFEKDLQALRKELDALNKDLASAKSSSVSSNSSMVLARSSSGAATPTAGSDHEPEGEPEHEAEHEPGFGDEEKESGDSTMPELETRSESDKIPTEEGKGGETLQMEPSGEVAAILSDSPTPSPLQSSDLSLESLRVPEGSSEGQAEPEAAGEQGEGDDGSDSKKPKVPGPREHGTTSPTSSASESGEGAESWVNLKNR